MNRDIFGHIEDMEFGDFQIEEPQAPSLSTDKDLEIMLRPDRGPGVWNARMVFDIALGVEDELVVKERYGLNDEEFNHIIIQPIFRKELAVMGKELRETGVSFATKAKLIAEETLEDIFALITNSQVAAKDRITAWSKVAEFAGLTPKADKGDNTNQNMVNIQINL